jgi:hypothetical protein
MGTAYAEIILKNVTDAGSAQRGYMTEKDVRECTVRALADTAAGTLVISGEVRQRLGLEIKGLRGAYLADGVRQVCRVTEPVEIRWKNRDTACPALLLPGAEKVLLGRSSWKTWTWLPIPPAGNLKAPTAMRRYA